MCNELTQITADVRHFAPHDSAACRQNDHTSNTSTRSQICALVVAERPRCSSGNRQEWQSQRHGSVDVLLNNSYRVSSGIASLGDAPLSQKSGSRTMRPLRRIVGFPRASHRMPARGRIFRGCLRSQDSAIEHYRQQGARTMTTKKNRGSRPDRVVRHSRRAKAQQPTLQMAVNERHTDWTCPVCRAVGAIDHAGGSSRDAILEIVRKQHSIKQPNCPAS
jgi:hypothetical protein